MSILESLQSRELIVVTGKGGVGKTAIAAALGRQMAANGRRTLILEVDPRENAHHMLDVSPSGGEIVPVGPRLFLQHLQPRQVLDRLVRERVRIDFVIRRILESPVYHHFSEGAPGLKEMAILGHALLVVQGRLPGATSIDTVVLDSPATGHGVSLLMAPLLVSEVIRQGPVATMTAEVAEMIADPERCGIVVVTLAEEMPVTEALELVEALRDRVDRTPELIVANALYPDVPAVDPELSGDASFRLWSDRRRLNDRQMSRLRAAWTGPLGEIPMLPIDRGPALVEALVWSLEEQ